MPILTFDDTPNPATELGDQRRIQVKIAPEYFGVTGSAGETLQDSFSVIFYTHAEPIYASVEYILLNGGENLECLPEAAIYLMSYAQSTLVDDMVTHGTSNQFFNRAKAEYVKCKTAADLLRAIISSKGTSVGRKTLADFSIDTSALGNLLQQSRAFLDEYRECYKFWETVLYSGGKADHLNPGPQAAVWAGYATSQAGIGRGWIPGGATLNDREAPVVQGNTFSRPRAFGSALTGSFPHHHDHLQNRAHCDPDVGN